VRDRLFLVATRTASNGTPWFAHLESRLQRRGRNVRAGPFQDDEVYVPPATALLITRIAVSHARMAVYRNMVPIQTPQPNGSALLSFLNQLARLGDGAGENICSASTKRALVNGDSESFALKRRRRAGLSKSAADVAMSESGPPPRQYGLFRQ
jgi:hypothetical protein